MLRQVKLFVLVTILIALLILCHRPLLRGAYRFLIHQDPAEDVRFVALVNGDQAALDRALVKISDGQARAVLIVERRQPRTVQIGAAPAMGDRMKQALIASGLSESSVEIISTEAVTYWQLARALDQHLSRRAPAARVAILFPEHQTRYLRWIVDRAVDSGRADQIDIWSFSPGAYDQDNWWSRRSAVLKVAVSYLRLIHAVGFGEGEFDANNWSPESYERALQVWRPAEAA